MIPEKMLELVILYIILKDLEESSNYENFIKENYDFDKLKLRYNELGKEFLQPYALNNIGKPN